MSQKCRCSRCFDVILGSVTEYKRLKTILNRGRHPAFIGRETVRHNAENGGLFFFTFDGKDIAVALMNPMKNTLLVLNVEPSHRSHGLGRAILAYLKPNFARVIEYKVPWFRSSGFEQIGIPKQGFRFKTAIMVRKNLISLAGRISKALSLKGTPLLEGKKKCEKITT